jgi:hypothetical protein
MSTRTEEQVMSRAPIEVTLGDTKYSIPILAVVPQRDWRKNLFATLVPILAVFHFDAEGKTVTDGLTAALLQFPEKLADMVFLYAPSLPQQEILASATEEQLCVVFTRIMNVAFPFVPEIRRATKILMNESALKLAATPSLQ